MVTESRVVTTKDELHENRLKFRLVGAAVLIALAVIFLPLIFDGSGTESQFRSMESIEMEPPHDLEIFDENEEIVLSETTRLAFSEKAATTQSQSVAKQIDGVVLGSVNSSSAETGEVPQTEQRPETSAVTNTGASDTAATEESTVVSPEKKSPVRVAAIKPDAKPAVPSASDASQVAGEILANSSQSDSSQWLIQTASFRDKINALSLRSDLKSAGYTVDVKVADKDGSAIFRVFVGPVKGKEAARRIQGELKQKFKRETLLVRQ